MRLPRMQFTIRGLMFAVAVLALVLAVWPAWPVLLLIFGLVGIPATAVILLAQVPWKRLPWRFGIAAFAPGFIVLTGGWLWARSMISSFQRHEGFIAIGAASRGAYYEYWGVTVPSAVTGSCLIALVLPMLVVCAIRRRFDLFMGTVGYALVMACAYVWLFADLEFEAFD
jgi:hypothetical protein